MKLSAALSTSFALAACTAQPPAAPRQTAALGSHVSCIELKDVTARRALAPHSVLFEMSGGLAYRNDLQGSCPGVERANGSEIVQTESQSSRLCRDDSVRVYDPVEARATGPRSFAKCRLGDFTPVAAD